MEDKQPLVKIPGFIVSTKLFKRDQAFQNKHKEKSSDIKNKDNEQQDSEQQSILPNRYNQHKGKNSQISRKQFNLKRFVNDFDFRNKHHMENDNNYQQQIKGSIKNNSIEKKEENLKSIFPVTHSQQKSHHKTKKIINPQLQQISNPFPQQKPLIQPFVQYNFQQMINKQTFQNLSNIQLILNDILAPEQAMSTVQELIDQLEDNSNKQKQQIKLKVKELIPNPLEVFFNDKILKKTTPETFSIDPLCETYSLLRKIDKSIRQIQFQGMEQNYQILFQALKNYVNKKFEEPIDNVKDLKFADNKKQLIKKSLISQQMCIILIGFCLAQKVLKQNKNFVLNLLKFSIYNNLFLLSQLIKSQQLSLLIKFYYPYIDKQVSNSNSLCDFTVIKHGNQIINQIFMKMSLQGSIFFGTLSTIVKECKHEFLLTTFKQLLSYLAFYVNSYNLTKNSNFFSTSPSPFIKMNNFQQQKKLYLVLDATDFYYKNYKKQIMLRPFTEYFLKQMSLYFNIVNLSNWSIKQANKIMPYFDSHEKIQNHLYNHHYERHFYKNNQIRQQVSKQQILIKNAQLFGPPIQKIYFLTTHQKEKLQKVINSVQNNIFYLSEWKITKKSDRKLVDICPQILQRIKKV